MPRRVLIGIALLALVAMAVLLLFYRQHWQQQREERYLANATRIMELRSDYQRTQNQLNETHGAGPRRTLRQQVESIQAELARLEQINDELEETGSDPLQVALLLLLVLLQNFLFASACYRLAAKKNKHRGLAIAAGIFFQLPALVYYYAIPATPEPET